MNLRWQAGDTIIEVLCAVVVFSMLAVGTIAIMNQGINTAQHSLEVTLVRQQIDAQADTLRYINQAYLGSLNQSQSGDDSDGVATQWADIRSHANGGAVQVFESGEATCPLIPGDAFIMDTHNTTVASQAPLSMNHTESPPPYSQVRYVDGVIDNAYGIWIESEADAGDAGVGYIDFHIRACWQGAGDGPATTLGTIVRLYDPHK